MRKDNQVSSVRHLSGSQKALTAASAKGIAHWGIIRCREFRIPKDTRAEEGDKDHDVPTGNSKPRNEDWRDDKMNNDGSFGPNVVREHSERKITGKLLPMPLEKCTQSYSAVVPLITGRWRNARTASTLSYLLRAWKPRMASSRIAWCKRFARGRMAAVKSRRDEFGGTCATCLGTRSAGALCAFQRLLREILFFPHEPQAITNNHGRTPLCERPQFSGIRDA